MKLLRFGDPVPTVFHLLGSKENDMTDALAFTLARSPRLLELLVRDLGFGGSIGEDAVLSVQTRRKHQGVTDLEIVIGAEFFAILEAKRGASLPSRAQLEKYAPVTALRQCRQSCMVTLSNATPEYATAVLSPPSVSGIPLIHRTWRQVMGFAAMARKHESNDNKRLLEQFGQYLRELIGMDTKKSNMVYVVSLAGGNPDGWKISWIDVVRKRSRYFYPIQKGWPDPPNYLGFRYGGRLQSIHHVDAYQVLSNPRRVFPEAPDDPKWGPCYCFELGPPIVPRGIVKAGPRVPRSNRVWCMLDTLLTATTVSEALTQTQDRLID